MPHESLNAAEILPTESPCQVAFGQLQGEVPGVPVEAPAVLDPSHLFQHLGYAAILVIVLLGNAGVPAPEESVLVLGGYLAWHGLGDWIERLRRAAGLREDAALFAAILAVAALAFIAMTWARDRRAARPAGPSDERDL